MPQGSGLSSSAAIECATLRALAALGGFADRVEGDPVAFARLAQRAENEIVGVPCGLMDQAASLGCIPGHALLLDCRDGSTRQVPFDPAAAGLAVVLIDSGVRHQVGGGPYAERRASVERAAAALGGSLREATAGTRCWRRPSTRWTGGAPCTWSTRSPGCASPWPRWTRAGSPTSGRCCPPRTRRCAT